MYTGDIVIHIDEELDNDRIHDLARQIGDTHGIYSAWGRRGFIPGAPFGSAEALAGRFLFCAATSGQDPGAPGSYVKFRI